jgi:hypothetical protein
MADRTDSEITPEPADSLKPAMPSGEGKNSTSEISSPMLDVHAPHEAIHTWKSFFIHIATIVIGLFIAVGLEQAVEFFHHQHQRLQLEEQVREVLKQDTEVIASDTEKLMRFRSYLGDLLTAVIARRRGQSTPDFPATGDPRTSVTLVLPGMAPYDAAKDNGTITLLGGQRVRLYNRVAFQLDMLKSVYAGWFDDLSAIGAFRRRYDYGPSGAGVTGVEFDVSTLSSAELADYQSLIGALINRVDWLLLRLDVFGSQCQAVLDGARDERDLTFSGRRTSTASSDKTPASRTPQ